VHSKTVVELVKRTDHASKMGHSLFIPLYFKQWVRQGGVLSAYLFAVYFDELSEHLHSARVGCTVRNMVVNHVTFADDYACSAPVLVNSNVF